MGNKEPWMDDYLQRYEQTVIKSIEKDWQENSLEELQTLLEIELSNDDRKKVIKALRDFIGAKEKPKQSKESKPKSEPKKETKEKKKKMTKDQYVIWRGSTNGFTLPKDEPLNRLQLSLLEEFKKLKRQRHE